MKGVFTSQPNYLPEGNAGAWWPSPCAQPPRTNSKRGLAWLARRPWSFHWSRSVSTLVVKSHSTPGLLVILTYPLKRKENINSGSHVKKDYWKYYKRNQMEHRISIAKMRTKKIMISQCQNQKCSKIDTIFIYFYTHCFSHLWRLFKYINKEICLKKESRCLKESYSATENKI